MFLFLKKKEKEKEKKKKKQTAAEGAQPKLSQNKTRNGIQIGLTYTPPVHVYFVSLTQTTRIIQQVHTLATFLGNMSKKRLFVCFLSERFCFNPKKKSFRLDQNFKTILKFTCQLRWVARLVERTAENPNQQPTIFGFGRLMEETHVAKTQASGWCC